MQSIHTRTTSIAAHVARRPYIHTPSTPRQPLLAAPEVNILTQADKCLGGECSVEDVSGAFALLLPCCALL
jgi:hypothetical protein